MPRSAGKLSPFSYLLWALPLVAQPASPAFEATTVRPLVAVFDGPAPPNCSGGMFEAADSILKTIQWAYGISSYQVIGKAVGLYEIRAESKSAVTEAQCRLMVQTLLADRFKLAVHRQTKPMSVYVLTVVKDGPKIKKASESDPGDGVYINGFSLRTYGAPKGWSMQQLVGLLSNAVLPTPVIDRTGSKGAIRSLWTSLVGRISFPRSSPSSD